MIELKTLRDLEKEMAKEGFCDWSICERLRAEGIKWAKELSKPRGSITFGDKSFTWDEKIKENWYPLAYRDIAKAVIMHLNDINEEDLQ